MSYLRPTKMYKLDVKHVIRLTAVWAAGCDKTEDGPKAQPRFFFFFF